MSQLHSLVWMLAAGLCAAIIAGVAFLAGRRRSERVEDRARTIAPNTSTSRNSGVFQKRQEILNTLSNDMSELLLRSRLEVQHLMSSRVKSVSPETPRAEVQTLMSAAQVRHLIVCRDHGELVGVISDRDIRHRRGQAAGDVMTMSPATVVPHTPISQVITMMVDRKISCVPVVDERGVQGVLTTTDLLLALQCSLRLFEQLSGRLSGETVEAGSANGAMACAALQPAPCGSVQE